MTKALVAVLVLNALFWGLASHASHCNLGAALGLASCVPHAVHVSIGVASFALAAWLNTRAGT